MPSLSLIALAGVTLVSVGYMIFQRSRSISSPTDLMNSPPFMPTKIPNINTKSLAVQAEEDLQTYKEVYHKLQNLEQHPDVLPTAKSLLLSLLEQGVLMGRYRPQIRSILDIKHFDPNTLDRFLAAERRDVSDRWEQYLERRKAGQGTELFSSRPDAIRWLKDNAPLNYIDGAWLCRVHKITTPFALREVTKHIWQTFSEELGDGDLEKNHVQIYRDLLHDVGVSLPDADTPDFINPKHGMNDTGAWKTATTQLLISLFPNEFLPEILGLNLHYEALAMMILRASKELPEVGISGYYFALHISIDNADSGHSAMAQATIVKFMEIVKKTGLMDYESTWKRIQAGYLLSQSLEDSDTVATYEKKVAEILHKKASLAGKIHCASRARVGKRSLVDWFSSPWADENVGETDDHWKQDFLDALADSKPWVYRGDSEKSLLMRELGWKGRMFGAFTVSEVELMRTWIDSLRKKKDAGPDDTYWRFVGSPASVETPSVHLRQDVAVSHPVYSPVEDLSLGGKHESTFVPQSPIVLMKPQLDALLPLWFAHPCLLENIVNSPYTTATPLASSVLPILRAESGYMPESNGVAGMDEQLLQAHSPDLVALGLEMVRKHHLPEPTCLGDALGKPGTDMSEAVSFAYDMLNWAMRPMKNAMFLLGLSRAFLDLEASVADDSTLLSAKGRDALQQLVERKMACFEVCLSELKKDAANSSEFVAGYKLGRARIAKVLA